MNIIPQTGNGGTHGNDARPLHNGVHKSVTGALTRFDPVRKFLLRFPILLRALRSVDRFLSLAAEKSYYDYFFRRSVFVSIIFLISINILLDVLLSQKALEDYAPQQDQSVRKVSDHTLMVVNAVPRTTLAQKRVKVPVIKEVEVALEEIDIPDPEFGAVEIGEDQPAEPGGTGEGVPGGRLPYRRPELVMLVPPVYPKDAEKDGVEGTVDLRILVTERGTVEEVEVTKSSGHPKMDEAAVRAARKTRFRPAVKDGQRVAMWINYPIQFALSRNN